MTLISSLYYQIFESDTNIIQILVWIIGSTYRKGKFWKQSWNVNTEQQAIYFTITRDTHWTMSGYLRVKIKKYKELGPAKLLCYRRGFVIFDHL